MNSLSSAPAVRRHSRFVKTPIISDTLALCVYQRGQWVKLAWCDKPSRFHSISARGIVTAFHYPNAARRFASYCNPGDSLPAAHRAKPLSAGVKTLLTSANVM